LLLQVAAAAARIIFYIDKGKKRTQGRREIKAMAEVTVTLCLGKGR